MKYSVNVNGENVSLKSLCDERGASYWTALNRYKRGVRDIDKLLSADRVQVYVPKAPPRKKKVKEVKGQQLDEVTTRILVEIKVERGLNDEAEAIAFLTRLYLAARTPQPQVKAKKKLFGIW